MKSNFNKRFSIAVLVLGALFLLFSCATRVEGGKPSAALSAAPGSFDNAAPAGLPAVIKLSEKLKIQDDELAIFYVY